jgi:hypothetical protein
MGLAAICFSTRRGLRNAQVVQGVEKGAREGNKAAARSAACLAAPSAASWAS